MSEPTSPALSAADSPEFSEWIASQKETFSERLPFNLFVCDELARRGVQPNSASVIKVGRWGNSNAVAGDVRTWFSNIAARLSARYPDIPNASQAEANALIEKLWLLAVRDSKRPLEAALSQLDEAHASLNQALSSLGACEAARVEDQRIADLAKTQFDIELESKHQEWLKVSEKLNAVEVRLVATVTSLESANARISEMAKSHAEVVAKIEAQHREALSRQAADREKVAAALAHSIEQANAQAITARKEAAVQIDAARQDAKCANDRAVAAENRADKARAESNSLKDELANCRVQSARTEQDLMRKSEALSDALAAASAKEESTKQEILELKKVIENLSESLKSSNRQSETKSKK